MQVRDGAVTLVSPLAEGDTSGVLRWEPAENGVVRRMDVDSLEVRAPRVVVGGPDATLEASLGRLDARARILREPLVLEGLAARVRLASDTLAVELSGGRVDSTPLAGTASVIFPDSGSVGYHAELALEDVDLAHFRWLASSLPPLTGDARVTGDGGPGGSAWRVTELDSRLEGGRVTGEGGVEFGGGSDLRLQGVSLRLTDVDLDALNPYLSDTLPVRGRASGTVRLSGPLNALQASGHLALDTEGYRPTEVEYGGTVALTGASAPSLQEFTATLEPMDWRLISAWIPSARLEGAGRAQVRATGWLESGLRFDADLLHRPGSAPPSHILASGSLRRVGDAFTMDIQGDLSPLSLDAVKTSYPDLPLGGEVSGSLRARGQLQDLEVHAQVDTELGRLDLGGRLDLRNPGASYQLEGTVADFRASALVPSLPEPSTFTGHVRVDGTGRDRSTMRANAEMDFGASRLGGLEVDTLRLGARIAQGVLTLDTLTARVGGFDLDAGGTLAVDTVQPAGEVRVRFATESLEGIRPVFMGDTVIARDTLTGLQPDLLELAGIDPDTLPTTEEVTVDGRVQGEFTLRGSVNDFSAQGRATLQQVRYGRSFLEGAEVRVDAEGLPGLAGRLRLEVTADSADVLQRSFASARAEVDYTRPRGQAVVALVRNDAEDYRARTRFELDSLGGTVDVDELGLRFDSLDYRLAEPAHLSWNDSAFVVRDFELVRPGPDSVHIRADGRLPRRGPADFTLDARGVRLERLAQLIQREDVDVAGRVDLQVRVEGTAADPRIHTTFSGRDVRAITVDLTRVTGEMSYQDRSADLKLEAWRDELQVLDLQGQLPVDLAFRGVEDRTPDRPMDLDLRADSLPAVFALALLEDLDDVQGTLSGNLRFQGTVEDPRPSGTMSLRGGAWTVGALGVRQSEVSGTFEVQPDSRVRVQVTGRAGGTVRVNGTVNLSPLTDPGLDLTMDFDRFQAVDRRDVAGTVSGQIQLTQSYLKPLVRGQLQVDQADIYLEEFQRSFGVVDLSDPRFFAYVDTSSIRGRPLLARTRNPFMDSLRVNVDLAVERDTWLRSPQMNVEMQGDLIVVYDRPRQDLVMIGELQAVRGQYTFLNRTFDVRSGTVEFVGTPGINPNLDIEAVARVRRRDGEPLDITANLTGTLVDPRVSLSTTESGVAQSDLISYLVFGRASSEVTTALSSGGSGSSGGGLLSGFGGQIGQLGLGSLANSLGALAQGTGYFDYLSISQAAESNLAQGGLANSVANTQVEVGRYFFGGDYFAALVLRPLSDLGPSGSLLGGFRVEWQASDQYHLEVFAEDRFLRSGSFGFQELGLRSSLIYGLSFFREWGY